MSALRATPSATGREPAHAGLPKLIDALEADDFGDRLQDFLRSICNADHCAVFRLGRGQVDALTAGSSDATGNAYRRMTRYVGEQHWRRDPALLEAHAHDAASPKLIQRSIDDLRDTFLRDIIYAQIRDRVLVTWRRSENGHALSILRAADSAPFSRGDLDCVQDAAPVLAALLEKRAQVRKSRTVHALASREAIESCLLATTSLPRREIEVCSRILLGVSAVGIGLDLRITEETVRTYRKRIYDRLKISSLTDLLAWYLRQRDAWCFPDQSHH